MNNQADRGAVFEQHRGKLWRIAYRMLGSRDDAEDMVQDAYLRWHRTSTEDVRAQDKKTLLGIFAEEATWTSDGGGKTKAALKVIHGAGRIARFAAGVFRNAGDRLEFRDVAVNEELGLAALIDGRLLSIITIRTDGRRILDVYTILNPEKLRLVQVP